MIPGFREGEADRGSGRCRPLADDTPVPGEVVQKFAVAVFQKVLLPGPVHILLDLVKVEGDGIQLNPGRVCRSKADRLSGDLFIFLLIVGHQPLHHCIQPVPVNEGNIRQVKDRP